MNESMLLTDFQQKHGDEHVSHLLSCRVITRTQSLPSSLDNYKCAASTCIDKRRLICVTHSKKALQISQSGDKKKRDKSKLFAKQSKGTERFWNWDVHTLTRVPILFPIERTHEVVKNSSPEAISHNISNLLQEESISVEYDNDNVRTI